MGCQQSANIPYGNDRNEPIRTIKSDTSKRRKKKGHKKNEKRRHKHRSKREITNRNDTLHDESIISPEEIPDIDKKSFDISVTSQNDSTMFRRKTIDTIETNDVILRRNSEIGGEPVQLEVKDSAAFNEFFSEQRQQAISNQSYQSTVDSWRANSLQKLVQAIQTLSKGKSLVDRHWIIFYWIARNIAYDTVSYFSKNYQDQTAEGVFRTRKGVCAGYANLYKYLCDQLEMPCEIVSGYSKGYGFEQRQGAPTDTDHAWNAVEIYHHWYLVESTWGAGNLDESNQFKRQLTSYYFLPRPNEMIYHHLPKNEKWQLLRNPINMIQYMQLPHLRPLYFDLKLELIQPSNTCFVNLEPNKAYALVILKTPTDVQLIADLKQDDKIIEGGHDVVFNKRKALYYCYFAPANVGSHKITIYYKHGDSDTGVFSSVLDLALDIEEMPENPISYPKKWKRFHDYKLKILSPVKTHLINLSNDEKYAEICIRAPSNIELMGTLSDQREEKVMCGDRVYYDQQKEYWRCQFAPSKRGLFTAHIFAKKKDDSRSFTSVVEFKVNAEEFSTPASSFPITWQPFYDLGLKILSPIDQGIILLREKKPFADIRIQTPDDIELSSRFENDKKEEIPDASQINYEHEQHFWRCQFAPNQTGTFTALIFAKKKSDPGSFVTAVSFKIEVKQLSSQPLSLLKTQQIFHDLDLKVLPPNDCYNITLPEKSSYVEIRVKAPNDVELLGQLKDSNREKIPNADEVYYDRRKNVWRCKFAPNNSGLFYALIMAKKKSDTGLYLEAVKFRIDVNHVPKSRVSYPKTWQAFYDYNLKVELPRSRATAVWSEHLNYSEIRIQAPDNIQLACQTKFKNRSVENGALAQYNHEKHLWQLLFAPEQVGVHELLIFAKPIKDTDNSATTVAMFYLNVSKLHEVMKFPTTFTAFETNKCHIYSPLSGILKKNSVVPIHCHIPGALSVTITVGSKTLRGEGYADPILQREITVGSEEITIHAKYGQNPHYITLIRYSVE